MTVTYWGGRSHDVLASVERRGRGLATYTTFPYRTEFPDSSERGRNSKTLEDALWWARWQVHSRWRETNEYGRAGEYASDTETAVITNRNTGYRWIVRRDDHRVEFQTPEMLEDVVSDQSVDLHLTVEETEALARAAADAKFKHRRLQLASGHVKPRPRASSVEF